jgi:hypothetical protein
MKGGQSVMVGEVVMAAMKAMEAMIYHSLLRTLSVRG